MRGSNSRVAARLDLKTALGKLEVPRGWANLSKIDLPKNWPEPAAHHNDDVVLAEEVHDLLLGGEGTSAAGSSLIASSPSPEWAPPGVVIHPRNSPE